MGTPAEYTAVANAIVPVLQSDVNNLVPMWARGLIPADAVRELAGQLAKTSVDAVDAFRTQEKTS